MTLNEFIYHKITSRLTNYPKIKSVLKFLNNTFYKNTTLNRDYRIKKWIKNSNKLIVKNKLCPVIFDGKETYFLNDSLKYLFDYNADGGGVPKYLNSDCDKNIFDYINKVIPSSKEITIFDIGANVGTYSLKFAKKYKNSKIYAFEPVKSTHNILAKNVSINNFDNVSCYCLALSDKNGELLMTNDEFTGNHIIKEKKRKNASIVKTITLDSFVKQKSINSVDVIKCDIEGAELMMLKGAIESIKKFKPIIILEVYEPWTKRYNYEAEDIFKLLLSMGYNYKISNEQIKPGNIKNLKKELSHCINFIFEV